MYTRSNRAAIIAQIGAINKPKITEGKSLDFGKAVEAYYRGKERSERDAKEKEQQEKVNAWVDQLNADTTLSDTDKAYFTANPEAYGQRVASLNNFDQQKELLGIKNQYDIAAAEKQAALAEKIAQIKAGGNGLVNINMNNPFDKKRMEKAASDMDANIAKAQEMKATFEQANNALQNIKTGTPLAMFTKNKPLFSNADEEAFDSAAAKSIDMVRKAGTGPMTDADARRYEKASIDRGKSKDANQLLIDSGIIAADNSIAREELRAEWVSNGGKLGDFDKEWRNYLNSNPIFGEDGKINKRRQDAFNWFYNPQQQPQNNNVDTNNDPFGIR
jgi:hypothetical protein